MTIRRRIAGIFLSIVAALLMAGVFSTNIASAQASPPTTLAEAYAFRHVVETDDLLVVVRFDLPVGTWQDAAYMLNPTCESDESDFQDIEAPCYTSLQEGNAFQKLYGTSQAAGLLRAIKDLPRVGPGISAVYLPAGHDITWGNAETQTCIEVGSSLATTPSCSTLQWNDTASIVTFGGTAQPFISALTLTAQTVMDQRQGRFVINGKVTEIGIIFWRESFPAILALSPVSFMIGTDNPFVDLVTPTPPAGALDSTITTAAEATALYTGVSSVGQEYLGFSGRFLGTLISLLLMGIVGIFIFRYTDDVRLALLGTFFPAAFGVYLSWIPLQWAFAFVALTFTIGISWIIRKTMVS